MSAAVGASAAKDAQWALSYEGKTTNEFIWDKRAHALIKTRVPAALSEQVLSALGGPPNALYVTGGRYVAVSACVPHYCPDKGFFWLDTETGVGLGATYGVGNLVLASNGLSAADLPGPARKALIDWLDDQDLMPVSVAFIDRGNRRTALDAASFAPPQHYRPADGGPSFDCAAAASRSEKAICGDAELSQLDLKLAALLRELRHGFGTTAAAAQLTTLQRAWLARRDGDCGAVSDLTACLAEHYRTQYTVLMNWVPSR